MPLRPEHSDGPALVVLAAGASTRYGRLKQLDPLGPGGAALLDYAVFDAARVGYGSVLLVIQEAKRRQFETRLAARKATGIPVRATCQSMDLPGVLERPPPGRVKPWGTGFALLAAREHLAGPFAACNADDFYGRRAFAAVAEALRGMSPWETTSGATVGSPPSVGDARRTAAAPVPAPVPAVTVGYRLAATLSDCGGVSRGLCEVGEDGTLRALAEGLNLRLVGDRVQGRDPAGNPLEASPDALACTSLWGFHPGILDLLAEQFRAFLATDPGPDAEFYLTEAVNALVAAGKVRCTVLPTDETWLGVTFPGDRDGVANALRKLVESGVYPTDL